MTTCGLYISIYYDHTFSSLGTSIATTDIYTKQF